MGAVFQYDYNTHSSMPIGSEALSFHKKGVDQKRSFQ